MNPTAPSNPTRPTGMLRSTYVQITHRKKLCRGSWRQCHHLFTCNGLTKHFFEHPTVKSFQRNSGEELLTLCRNYFPDSYQHVLVRHWHSLPTEMVGVPCLRHPRSGRIGLWAPDGAVGVPVHCRQWDQMAFKGRFQLKPFCRADVQIQSLSLNSSNRLKSYQEMGFQMGFLQAWSPHSLFYIQLNTDSSVSLRDDAFLTVTVHLWTLFIYSLPD